MRVGVVLHNRPRLEFHEAHQHGLPGGENVNTRKDGMLAAGRFIDKVGTLSG